MGEFLHHPFFSLFLLSGITFFGIYPQTHADLFFAGNGKSYVRIQKTQFKHRPQVHYSLCVKQNESSVRCQPLAYVELSEFIEVRRCLNFKIGLNATEMIGSVVTEITFAATTGGATILLSGGLATAGVLHGFSNNVKAIGKLDIFSRAAEKDQHFISTYLNPITFLKFFWDSLNPESPRCDVDHSATVDHGHAYFLQLQPEIRESLLVAQKLSGW